jgi:hypothetical protein
MVKAALVGLAFRQGLKLGQFLLVGSLQGLSSSVSLQELKTKLLISINSNEK